MAATLQWQISTASSGSFSLTDKLRFKAANDNTDDTNDPLIRPTSGTNYSWEKALHIYVSVVPSVQLTNLRVLMNKDNPESGTPVPIVCYYGFISSYVQPVGTNSGIATTALHSSEIVWAGGSGPYPASTGTGFWGQILYLQLDILDNATGGEITDWQTIARYDEI